MRATNAAQGLLSSGDTRWTVAEATSLVKQFSSLLSRLSLVPLSVLIWVLKRVEPEIAGLLGTHQVGISQELHEFKQGAN